MTVQFRLTIRFIVVVLLAGVVLSATTVYHIVGVLFQEVRNRVRLDLNSARSVYESHAEGIGRFLSAAAMDPSLQTSAADAGAAGTRLRMLRETGGMDILCLTDGHGAARACADRLDPDPHLLADNPLIAQVLRTQAVAVGTVIVPGRAGRPPTVEQVAASGPAPALDNEPHMALAAAVPVRDSAGRTIGVLYGAAILNHRYDIVDAIRDEVYQGQRHEGKDIGTATIFQGDLRISTNVQTSDGRRAVGTRMSPQVAEEVLVRGQTYNAPAFVVNDWYITAYGPIRDPAGRIVGALYVGLLQEPFIQARNTVVGVFLVTVTGTTVAILLLLFFLTRQVLRPVDQVVAMTARVAGGDLGARVGIRPAGELGRLCQAVDQMADAVAQREEQLKLAARRQISQSEKLASIGRLAAGIAHEVNNPLTGVLTFTHLLRQKPNLDDQDRADLDLVIRETTRVRDIVRGLLDFARESPTRREWLDINEVVRQATRLLRGQKEFVRVTIDERLSHGLPPVYGDRNQLQQVFLNLSLNACEAMTEGGTLTITTSTGGDVSISFADTGHGINPDDLDKIFEPFFTTKPVGKGTGLGLSVSYGIVQQHGGTFDVQSAPGRGTVFTVTLPTRSET